MDDIQPNNLTLSVIRYSKRPNIGDNVRLKCINRALSGYHQDVANAIIACEFCDFTESEEIIRQRIVTHEKAYYIYNDSLQKWTKEPKVIVERDANASFISRLEALKDTIIKQDKELNYDDTRRYGNVSTIKRIESLVGKLKTNQYYRSVWSLINRMLVG